jgi:hypothetical protein
MIGNLSGTAGPLTGTDTEGWSITGDASMSGGISTDESGTTVHYGGFVPTVVDE